MTSSIHAVFWGGITTLLLLGGCSDQGSDRAREEQTVNTSSSSQVTTADTPAQNMPPLRVGSIPDQDPEKV